MEFCLSNRSQLFLKKTHGAIVYLEREIDMKECKRKSDRSLTKIMIYLRVIQIPCCINKWVGNTTIDCSHHNKKLLWPTLTMLGMWHFHLFSHVRVLPFPVFFGNKREEMCKKFTRWKNIIQNRTSKIYVKMNFQCKWSNIKIILYCISIIAIAT